MRKRLLGRLSIGCSSLLVFEDLDVVGELHSLGALGVLVLQGSLASAPDILSYSSKGRGRVNALVGIHLAQFLLGNQRLVRSPIVLQLLLELLNLLLMLDQLLPGRTPQRHVVQGLRAVLETVPQGVLLEGVVVGGVG